MRKIISNSKIYLYFIKNNFKSTKYIQKSVYYIACLCYHIDKVRNHANIIVKKYKYSFYIYNTYNMMYDNEKITNCKKGMGSYENFNYRNRTS